MPVSKKNTGDPSAFGLNCFDRAKQWQEMHRHRELPKVT
jgi:hypothetical protein